jgi:ribA/ribD-fused uncharacterized protein
VKNTANAITYFDDFEGPNPYGFLSNFYLSPLTITGIAYPSGEHAFQAYKATNLSAHRGIARASSPAQAKRKGKAILLRPDWETVKYDVMRQVIRAKFAVGIPLSERLLATGDAMLIEGNSWNDQVWGVDKKRMRGRNWLGHLLMARRAELRSGYGEPDYTVALAFIR